MKRVYLRNEEERRAAAVALASFAVDGAHGRRPPDPIHEWITEGRRSAYERHPTPAAYSSCGDLAHWLLMCLGCRDEAIVNRGDDGGVKGWAVGTNVGRLVGSPWYVRAKPGLMPTRGDILHVASPDHVCVLLSLDDDWSTADYGQPYGLLHRCDARWDGGRLIVRGRTLQGWIDVSRVALTPSAIVPDAFDGEVDDNPYVDSVPAPTTGGGNSSWTRTATRTCR